MEMEHVRSLFCTFTGLENPAPFTSFLRLARIQVLSQLRDGADETDPRLEYVAAALANLLRLRAEACRDKPACTFAGTAAQDVSDRGMLQQAALMLSEYRAVCTDLLKDTDFFFLPCGKEAIPDAANPSASAPETDLL